MLNEHRPHFLLKDTKTEFKYKSTKTVPLDKIYPNRQEKGRYLQKRLLNVQNELYKKKEHNPKILNRGGDYFEFIADKTLYSANSFENVKAGIKLLNVKKTLSPEDLKLTVFIPDKSSTFFEARINSYLSENTENGNPKFQDSIASIKDISLTELKDLWLDDYEYIPQTEKQWCEIWFYFELSSDIDILKKKINHLGIEFRDKIITFPEKVVILCKVNQTDLIRMIDEIGYISEIHLFWEPISFYTKDNTQSDNNQWIANILNRIQDQKERSRLCILDTGISYNHPLDRKSVV